MCEFKIQELSLFNYRRFENKKFILNPRMNVFAGKNGSRHFKANGDYTFNHFTAPGFGAVSDRTYLCQLLFICVFGIPRDKKAFRYCTNCGVEMRFSILILPKVCYIIL